MIEVKDIKRLGNLKEEENLRFRQFLKMNADSDKLDSSLKNYIINILKYMTVQNVGIVVEN